MIRPLANLSSADREVFGGKASMLGELTRLGIPVPDGFALSVEYWYDFWDRCCPDGPFGKWPGTGVAAIADVERCRACAAAVSIPLALQEPLWKHFALLHASEVAVRSSALAEDSARMSFAGVFTSVLQVRETTLLDAIRECWLSALSPRAFAYAQAMKGPSPRLAMGIVVQRMVKSLWSGVCFTADPVTGDSSTIHIEVAAGDAAQLVSGRVSPIHYVVERTSAEIVTAHGVGASQIDGRQISALAAQCRLIAGHMGAEQDIEFVIAAEGPQFVQTRPITTRTHVEP